METYRERVARAEPRFGDLLYSREGAYFGVAAEVPADTLICLGQRMVLLRPPSGALDHRFLKYWMNSPMGRAYAQSHREGSAAPRINLPAIRSFPVPWPPIDEQRHVASTVGALDDKIESNRRTIYFATHLLDLLAAVVASDIDSVSPLVELVEVSREAVNPVSLVDTPVDHYSIPAFDESVWPERVSASSIMSSKLLIRRPSILVSRLNPRFNRTWWCEPQPKVPALASTEFLAISTPNAADLGALWLAVRDEYFRTELRRRATGTSGSHQRIRPDDALTIEVPDIRRLPEADRRRALELLELIAQRRTENVKLAALRDTLLPELLSGRIRVPEAAEAVEEIIE
jgi:type I restriction enzyme S subunit